MSSAFVELASVLMQRLVWSFAGISSRRDSEGHLARDRGEKQEAEPIAVLGQ